MAYMDTQMQKFWTEAINKEAALRFGWQLKYSKTFAKQVAEKNKQLEQHVPPPKNVTNPIENITRRIKKMERELRGEDPDKDSDDASEETRKSRAREEENLLNFRDMRSPSPKTRLQLYEGISHHQEGRYAYLKARKKKSPEEKYVFPILSSTQYGWKIHDHMMPKSEYARNRIIRDTFYRHSGIITG
jgi:hypothetical protein